MMQILDPLLRALPALSADAVAGALALFLLVLAYLLLALRRLSGEAVTFYSVNIAVAVLAMLYLGPREGAAAIPLLSLWIVISVLGIAVTLRRPVRRMTVTMTTPHRGPRTAAAVRRGMQPLIDSFCADSDVICIDVDVPDEDGRAREVTLEPWTDGVGVDIRVDGVLAARVKDAVRIRPEQIRLLPRGRTGEAARIHRLTL